MRAARLHAAGDLRVGEEPTPAADAGMSLVRAISPAARRTGLKVLIEPLHRAVTLCRLGWGSCVRCGWRWCSTWAACWRS